MVCMIQHYPLDNVVKTERYDHMLHNTLDDNNATRDVSQYDKCPKDRIFLELWPESRLPEDSM